MNIIFDKIIINNFLSIGTTTSVDLSNQNFVLVNGRNEESATIQSNGAGKSTIFDAIFWTLTGKTLRGTLNVSNEYGDNGAVCTLEFHSENQMYSITRTKDHKEFGNSCKFYIDGVLSSDQLKKSQEMIEKVIPTIAIPEILGSIILLGQGLPYKFSALSPMKRKELLETMSNSSAEIELLKYKLEVEEAEHQIILNNIKAANSEANGIIIGLKNTIDLLNKQISSIKDQETITKEIKENQRLIDEASKDIANLSMELFELEAKHNKYTSMEAELTQFKFNIEASLSNINEKLLTFKSGNCPICGRPFEVSTEVLEQINSLKQEQDKLNSQLDIIVAKLIQISQDLSEINLKISEKTNLKVAETHNIEEWNRQIQELSNLNDNVTELNTQLTTTEDSISRYTISINENNNKITQEQEVLDCINYLKRQISRDFKGYILQEVISFLSERSEYYSQYLFTNGKKVKITLSGSSILILVGSRLYENLSGGEKQRVDLIIQFSLRDMLMTMSNFTCNLLVLDEVFDNLDAQGSEALIQLIISEFSDIDSMFVITHHSEIDIPYDKQITVVKGANGTSSLE